MATVSLPDDPSFEQLRKQAKKLRDQARAGMPAALALVAAHHPDAPARPVTLAGAQLVVARRYGFSSWAALKRHVQTIERYRRAPDEVNEASALADQFLLHACLRYGRDDAAPRWHYAARLLAQHPEITRASVPAAAAAADVDALTALLAEDGAQANAESGPFRWQPLLYLVYARHDPYIDRAATLQTARLLLDHGADPDAGYLWHGLTTAFTALTGALGGGEVGQPAHPHGFELARMLLAAGANANDGQALYNRQFGADNTHLALLLEHGLGLGDGGPWRARLSSAAPSPSELVRDQLWWAVVHDMADRVRLLAEHGAAIDSPFDMAGDPRAYVRTARGKTPAQLAALCGCPAVLDYLVEHGAQRPPAQGADGLIAALLAGDSATVQRLREHAAAARRQRPGLIAWAVARQAWHAVPVLVELGFDINARTRTDVPLEQEWHTALHEAASDNNVDGVRLLIDLGADPTIKDARFDATALGWAEHFGHRAVADFLRTLTTAE
jgi:ankyrin repeat protein